MSQGSIKNRIQQNNTELNGVINTVEELPDYVDTSDATAVATDITAGKTAYVNDTLITGTLPEVVNPTTVVTSGSLYNGVFFKPDDAAGTGSNSGSYTVTATQGASSGTSFLVNWVKVTTQDDWYIKNQSKVKVGMPYDTVANVIGLTANKIKKDETILGVTGTFEGAEDLTNVLNAQDARIAELENTLALKTKEESTPNIFLQTTEPTSKQGIWLQVADKEYEKVVAEDTVVEAPSWLPDGSARAIPYNFYGGNAITVGTNIYILGGATNPYNKYNYKYNTLTDTYTQLTNIPYTFSYGGAAAVGTDIYLFGSSNTNESSDADRFSYKYDTLTDTWTKLSNMPYKFCYRFSHNNRHRHTFIWCKIR